MYNVMPEFSDIERPPVFPICLIIDVSLSMYGDPIDAVNEALPGLRRTILGDPAAGEIARLAVVTFSHTAKVVLPLTDLREARQPLLAVESSTNFAAGFRLAREVISTGIERLGRGTRFYRPVVVFLSDGEHNAPEDWHPAWQRLTDRGAGSGAEVVSFGMGLANRQAITEVSTGQAYFAGDPDPATAVRAILSGVGDSIKALSGALSRPEGGTLVVPEADGLTRLSEGGGK
ncbi:VWA domain-containing protein [Nocardia sp. NPDC127526]|uniref:vWA domain-containing protein n=1 Tax=Nocardia sp. NPDC127526 TaxID=3345393 RepID=UPI003629B65E